MTRTEVGIEEEGTETALGEVPDGLAVVFNRPDNSSRIQVHPVDVSSVTYSASGATYFLKVRMTSSFWYARILALSRCSSLDIALFSLLNRPNKTTRYSPS